MKVLMVNKFLFENGGSETYVFTLGKQLEKNGHEVQYFGMEHPDRVVGNRIFIPGSLPKYFILSKLFILERREKRYGLLWRILILMWYI